MVESAQLAGIAVHARIDGVWRYRIGYRPAALRDCAACSSPVCAGAIVVKNGNAGYRCEWCTPMHRRGRGPEACGRCAQFRGVRPW